MGNYINQLKKIHADIKIKLDSLLINTLSRDNEEIYSIMTSFNSSIIFLLNSKEDIDKHFINQKEPTEILESKEISNIVDIQNKRIKKCIMEFMNIELKSCEQCNFNQVCDWIKKETKEEIDPNEVLKNLLELEKADNTRLNMEIQELLIYIKDSINNISKIQGSPFSDGMAYILLQMCRMIERID